MIFVEKSVGRQDAGWTSLIEMARAQRQALEAAFNAGGAIAIDQLLYKRFKADLLAQFHDKCAYCETLITPSQHGDVEHFRPKKRVVGDDNKPVRVQHPQRGEINHPGYYWLAYEWSNLFPSCNLCNRRGTHGKDRVVAGKADFFPVVGSHAFMPGQETAEQVLLINPSEVDPMDHLEFYTDGKVRGRTPIGDRTIDLLGLNVRERLVEERQRAYEEATSLFERYYDAAQTGFEQRKQQTLLELQQINRGEPAYCAMRRLAIVNAKAKALAALDAIGR